MGSNRVKDVDTNFFTPRDYQVELVDRAVDHNSIVTLGTGSGKTFIAVMLIKEYAYRLVEDKKKAIFLVHTVPLVEQQAARIACHTDLIVKVMHGNLNADIWSDKAKFEKFAAELHVLVLTAQVFLDLLNHAFFDISQVALMIFDECHHCLGQRHPYRLIMDHHREMIGEKPRILGLTASVVTGKISLYRLEDTLRKLETIMDAKVETASDIVSVVKYGARPKQLIVKCENSYTRGRGAKLVKQILNSLREFTANCVDFHPDLDIDPRKPVIEATNRTLSLLEQLGPWCAWKVCGLWQKRFSKLMTDPFLGPKQKRFLGMAETAFQACTRALRKCQRIRSYAELVPYINHKVIRTLEVLRAYHDGEREKRGHKDQLSGIIFVDQRYVAYIMNLLIKSLAKWNPAEFGFIKADFVVGHSGTLVDTEDAMVAHKRQEQVLQSFRQSKLNLLIATSVLEEGIDVRQCNVVMRFDPPKDFRSYVQSRGRARKEHGTFYVIAEEKDCGSVVDDLSHFNQIEELLLKRFKSRDNPVIDEPLLDSADNIVPPYVVDSTGAKVSMSTAIALVNRYCSKLPSDIFTRLVPQIRAYPDTRSSSHVRFRAELILPINSPVKETIALKEPLDSKAKALMAVALQACKTLHERKELNDHLLPVGKDTVANLLNELDEEDFLAGDLPMRTGSAKKRRLYDRKISRLLNGILPSINTLVHVYVIDMVLVRPISEEHNPKKRRIVDPHEVDCTFGFISRNTVPSIAGFPVFQRQGETEVRIRKSPSQLLLTEYEMTLISLFHQHLFEDILRLVRGDLEFCPEKAAVPLLLVPLKKVREELSGEVVDYVLDHKFLSEGLRQKPTVPSEEQRKNFKFSESTFLDTVVSPWYRGDEKAEHYYVAEICRSFTPASQFPDAKFGTFNEYFLQKYNIQIYDQQQNLLDVDYTSSRMNLLLPRPVSKSTVKKHADPSQRQILVPELVHIHPLSASLWTMIIALPTVLYRLNALLLADELRQVVARDALGIPEAQTTPDDYDWGTLTYPTAQSDETQQTIKNLDHLKKVISAEKRPVAVAVNGGEHSVDGVENDDHMEADNNFDIGVWDPSLAEDFQPRKALVINGRLTAADADEASESVAVGGSTGIHNYADMSDEEDEDYNILFDFKLNMHEKLTNSGADPFAPKEVATLGWDDGLSATFEASDDACPLAITGFVPEINMASLMKDLEANFGKASAPSSSTNAKNEMTPAQRKTVQKRLYLDPLEALDDSDKLAQLKHREEVIDLISFDDEVATNQTQVVDVPERMDTGDDSGVEDNEEGQCAASTSVASIGPVNVPEVTLDTLVNGKFTVVSPDTGTLILFGVDTIAENPYGVPPTLLLQALTTCNASDGINLERLETIGDSFLKLSVTNYLYHNHIHQDEGKLSYARSKEVSNTKLYKLGRKRGIPSLMEASKFDPHSTWLPPAYVMTSGFHAINLMDTEDDDLEAERQQNNRENGWDVGEENQNYKIENGVETITLSNTPKPEPDLPPFPYNMMTQQYISDKSIADCVEALIGAHLITLGPNPALKFMSWLGVKVITEKAEPPQPLLRFIDTEEQPDLSRTQLFTLYKQYQFENVEKSIGYHFGNKAYLVQAFTHASYYKNRVTGCYQRLEFLGDAVLDYLITRFLFEHKKQYSPGVLTDLRSALVNNTIFASLAVKYNFHKHFLALCPGLHTMIEKFVKLCETNQLAHCPNFNDEMFMVTEEEIDEGHEEDVEVPKALGDMFESVAGAVYLDCGMDLDIVWRVFYNLMSDSIEECCRNPPQSPIRELFEFKNYKARFTKLERILETGRVRVTVDIDDKLRFVGMARSYRIAKCTAAKKALRYLRTLEADKQKAAANGTTKASSGNA